MKVKSQHQTLRGVRRASIGCSVSVLALVLATSGALAQDKIKVGLILPSYDQIRWQNGDQPCFEAEAKKLATWVLTQK